MGVVAQSGQGAAVLHRPSAGERARARIAAVQPSPEPAPSSDQPAPQALPQPSAPAAGPTRQPAEPPTASDPAARGRLKLTPTATDDEFKAVFDQAAGQSSAEDSGWTWKELLTTLDGDAAGEDAKLGAALFTEIEGMGIDPAALLPTLLELMERKCNLPARVGL